MNPKNPSVLYAATYDKERLPWQIVNGGPGSGIYKTTDGGRDLDEARRRTADADASAASVSTSTWSNPEILYAVIENDEPVDAAGAGAGRGGAGTASCRSSAARCIARQTAGRRGRR